MHDAHPIQQQYESALNAFVERTREDCHVPAVIPHVYRGK
jgi:hypothetical protein